VREGNRIEESSEKKGKCFSFSISREGKDELSITDMFKKSVLTKGEKREKRVANSFTLMRLEGERGREKGKAFFFSEGNKRGLDKSPFR